MEEVIKTKLGELFNIQGKEHQIHALSLLLSENETSDIMLNLPVGYGKSLVYQAFPLLYEHLHGHNAVSLVITPLNIIQNDQMDSLKER